MAELFTDWPKEIWLSDDTKEGSMFQRWYVSVHDDGSNHYIREDVHKALIEELMITLVSLRESMEKSNG